MSKDIDRRRFLQTSASTGLVAAASSGAIASAARANNKLVVGVMGTNGRGTALARGFAAQKDCEIAYICDVDSRAVSKGVAAAAKVQGKAPQGVSDFRKVLDDKAVDILVVAAPNHWHAPAAILGCAAGKHVYVEKPCSHNPHEGELMVAAARKHDKVVQMGTQRRSWPKIIEAIEKVRGGEIGKVYYSKSWYNNRRGSIGRGKETAVPTWLDYTLWQGPAPEVAYRDNILHYNWHWMWNWGCGELGNNGVHSIDVSRWGLGVDYPTRVTSSGGRYRWDDDQQTPDTHSVSFEFGDKMISWECLSWSPRGTDGSMFGISFHGDQGTLMIIDSGYKIYDMHNKEIESKSGSGGDAVHQVDFLSAIRDGHRPHAEIEIGHKSTLLCHLGNIAHRTQRSLTTDPSNGHILGDAEAQKLWRREYRPGWEPTV